MTPAEPQRPNVHPSILTSLLGGGNYVMPMEFLPTMDCDNCIFSTEEWRDGGHCYMFKEKPDGTHCGQYKPRKG